MSTTLLLSVLTLCAAQEVRVERGPIPPMPDIRQPAPPAQPVQAHDPRASARRPAVPTPPTAESLSRQIDEPARRALGADLAPKVHFDVDDEGRHWVRGGNYKASFGPDGASFIPFLGSDAPRNLPLRFSVAAIGQGGAAAPLMTPSVARTAERVVLDQGAVRSEYVPGLAGLEQLFVLDAPLGEGALVLDLAVDSELVARPDGAGWRFEHALGAVAYGAAFVLDADGRRLDLETFATADGLRFVVPAEFMAEAAWPIAIDPLIANVTVDTAPIDQLEVDVAFDPTTSRYLVVFAEVFSATDHDIQSWLVGAAGAVVAGSNRYLDFTAASRTAPRVAMTNVRRSFLCAYVEGNAARRIGARARNADSSAVGAPFIVDLGSANDRYEADICGDSFTASATSAHYTVVWRRFWNSTDSDVIARVVNEDGTFVTSEIYVTNFIGISDEAPSISKCITPGTDDSVVVWRRDHDVFASMISFDGGTVRNEFSLFYLIAPSSGPQVSGLSTAQLPGSTLNTFVACCDSLYLTLDRDVLAVVAAAQNDNGVTPIVSSTQRITEMEHVELLDDQGQPDVACTGDSWVITQNAVYPGATDYVTRATTVNIVGNGLGVSERFLALTQTFSETLTPRIASQYEAGNVGSREAFTGWIQQTNFGQPGNVYGAVHSAYANNTCASQYCLGFANGTGRAAFIWVEGDFSTTGTKRLRAIDMYPNAFGYFLTSMTPDDILPPNSSGRLCLGGSIGRYSGSVLNSGPTGAFSLDIDPTAMSQPTGAVSAMSGQTWYFQAWHRDVMVGTGMTTSNFTNAAGLPFQ